MKVTVEMMTTWCRRLLGADADLPQLTLEEYSAAIPRLDSLADLPAGTPVLIRGDVDAKPGAKVGEGDVRLRSMAETLKYGREKGWKQIIFGHIGRKPEGSLEKVRARLGEILGCEVGFIADWLDSDTVTIKDEVSEAIEAAEPGSVIVLENTRKYDVERLLWKATPDDIPQVTEKLARFANQLAEKVATIYINEAFSAGSLDASSAVVPIGMDRVALGSYLAEQYDGPLKDCLKAEMVVFSGLKIDKLDDLEAMVNRGAIRRVITAGSLAMALKKGAAELDGKEFDLGVSQDPAHRDKPYFVPKDRVEQAKNMIAEGRGKGIEFVMPVDFVLQDGQVSETIGPGNQQFDVGPASSKLFEEAVGQFIETSKAAAEPAVMFHNGVFGMFEDARFESGTKNFVPQLKRMTDAGVKVYVGGGEGGKSLRKYGQPDWVTYCFTAGGTVLNALGSEPVPYMLAMKMACDR